METNAYRFKLYPHNARTYEIIKKAFETSNVAAIVHSTGTGKSYVGLQYSYDNRDKSVLYVVPYNSIIEHLKEIVKNIGLDLEKDFKNIKFTTYSSLRYLSEKELKNMNVDVLILDEFHHIGAPVWGSSISKIIDSHKDLKILGMSAYTVRNKGKNNERNMVNPEADELFSNKVVSIYDLSNAIIDGVLPKPIYKSGYVFLEDTIRQLEQTIRHKECSFSLKEDLNQLLLTLIDKAKNSPKVGDIFKESIKRNGKYIYFCRDVEDIKTSISDVKTWLKEMGINEEDYFIYQTTGDMKDVGKQNRMAFYTDTDLSGKNIGNKLRIMFAINQYNEGAHVPNIDGVIMGRETESHIVYYEQFGRALSTKSDFVSRYEQYDKYSVEELKDMCDVNGIQSEGKSKEQLIESLICPVIIDLANNIDFIRDLESDLKERKSIAIKEGKKNIYTTLDLDPTFDIEMLNEKVQRLINYTKSKITGEWEDFYMLAEAYHDKHGNINIPLEFKTLDGVEYCEYGYNLGKWLAKQKREYFSGTLSEQRVDLLELLNIVWNPEIDNYVNKFFKWKKFYCDRYDLDLNDVDDDELLKDTRFRELHCVRHEYLDVYRAVNARSLDDLDEEIPVETDLSSVYNDEAREILHNALKTLTAREEKTIRLRYGLDDDIQRTLGDIAEKFGVSSESIRNVENKALSKLRYSSKTNSIRGLFDGVTFGDDGISPSEISYICDMNKQAIERLGRAAFLNLHRFFQLYYEEQKERIAALCYYDLGIKISDFFDIVKAHCYAKNKSRIIKVGKEKKRLIVVTRKAIVYPHSNFNPIIDSILGYKSLYANKMDYLEEYKSLNNLDEWFDSLINDISTERSY